MGLETLSNVQSSGNKTSFHMMILGTDRLTCEGSVKHITVSPVVGNCLANDFEEFETL